MKNKILSFLKKYNSIILFVAIIVFILLYLQQCNANKKLKLDSKINNQNLIALNDSVKNYKDKNNNIGYEKATLILNNKDLKKTNTDLYNQLKAESGKVAYLSNIVANININPIHIVRDSIKIYPKNILGIKFDSTLVFNKNNKLVISGESKFKIIDSLHIFSYGTTINKNSISLNIITGIKKDKDNILKIFVKSDYPNFVVSDITGDIVSPEVFTSYIKPKKWSIGPIVGYGINSSFKLGGFIGVGISYKVIAF